MASSSCAAILQSIAFTIADYRQGEITAPDAAHVERWIDQFPSGAHLGMLTELDQVLKKTYFAKSDVVKFLEGLVTASKLVGADPTAFWTAANFLNIQQAGASQTDMLALFDGALTSALDISVSSCGSSNGPFVYLDDASFTGNRILKDCSNWLQCAPGASTLHIILMAIHRGGQFYADSRLTKAATAAGKTVNCNWWRVLELEDRNAYIQNADVLRPQLPSTDPDAAAYVGTFTHPVAYRSGTMLGANGIFASDPGRRLLEEELLKAGVRIRGQSPRLGDKQRPLGNSVLEMLGFGSTLVTFRNCPNNCPLAFWAGDPWYPLFPRKTN